MRSKVTKKIIASIPNEIRESVREQANDMVNRISAVDIIKLHSPTPEAGYEDSWIVSAMMQYGHQWAKMVDKEWREENESLKQSLRELIPLAECTVIPDGPEKDMMKEIWPGTHSEMEKRQAAIDRAKSKL